MAYTKENLTAVQNAIIALATGTRAVEVSFGKTTLKYGETDIAKLQALKSEIATSLHRPRRFLVATKSGL